jgi:hypothetical protein
MAVLRFAQANGQVVAQNVYNDLRGVLRLTKHSSFIA